MTRRFANPGEDHVNGGLSNDGKPLMQTHFEHGLAAVAATIESLLFPAGIRFPGNRGSYGR